MDKEVLLAIEGMHCATCQTRIEKKLYGLPGITTVQANYDKNTVFIVYNPAQISLPEIETALLEAGYAVRKTSAGRLAGILFVFFAILLLADFTGNFDMTAALSKEVTYLLLFTIGLFTSLHCMGMCGGIMLSQTVSAETRSGIASVRPALLYNAGRVLSYTVLGGAVGAVGSVISLSTGAMAAIAIFAGIFMILMGLNLAGMNWFRRYLRFPVLADAFARRPQTPLAVGLLNGIMPCGPLQTMQLYALSTGSAVEGALAMLVFSLGTVPLMLLFGSATGFMSKGMTARILRFSGVLVIVLGLIMTGRGFAIAGINLPIPGLAQPAASSASPAAKAEIKNGVQLVRMSANSKGYVPNVLYIQKGVPVKWIINGEQINSCNNEIIVPSHSIRKKLTTGETVIEFTPGNEDINFSCWMGMIRGILKVVDDVSKVDVAKSTVSVPSSSGCTGDCCAGPAGESIYGPDLAKVPTERIIKKSSTTAAFKGIGYELEPLVILSETPGVIKLDLTSFDQPEGKWEIVDFSQKAVIKTFEGRKEVIEIEFPAVTPGSYGIFKDRNIKGIVECVADIRNEDIAKTRKKYF